MDNTDPISDIMREKEKAYQASQLGNIGRADQPMTANQINKSLSRLGHLQNERDSLIKRLGKVNELIEYLKSNEYVLEGLSKFDELDRFGW